MSWLLLGKKQYNDVGFIEERSDNLQILNEKIVKKWNIKFCYKIILFINVIYQFSDKSVINFWYTFKLDIYKYFFLLLFHDLFSDILVDFDTIYVFAFQLIILWSCKVKSFIILHNIFIYVVCI